MAAAVLSIAAGAILGKVLAPKAPKQAAVPTQEEKVVPLPDANSEAVRRRAEEDRRLRRGRRGYSSTLVSGQMGDTSPPPVTRPMVTGG